MKQACFKPFLLLVVLTVGLVSCQPDQVEPGAIPMTLFRRSVLDQKIRMLSLRFGDDRFAAYDLENDRLHKVWRGGVLWNGAAFNNMKTVQPESYGTAYWEDDGQRDEWWIEVNRKKQPAKLSFRAFLDLEDGPTLEYQLAAGKDNVVTVREAPRFREVEGVTTFERHFQITAAQPSQQVYRNEALISQDEPLIVVQAESDLPPAPPPARAVSTNNSQYWLERSGCNTCHHETEKEIGPSYEAIAANYEATKENIALLSEKVRKGGSGQWGNVAMIPHPNLGDNDLNRMVQYILSLRPKVEGKAAARPKAVSETMSPDQPGFGTPVAGVHPGLELINFRPADFRPRVGGMAFLPDGQLLVSTWDSTGAVYALSGLETGDSSQIDIRMAASGLSEPLGLTTVGKDIFVLQKHELTQLIDLDGDGITDEYRQINDQFEATPDFHEYSYGLEYRDGNFYGGLGLAMRLMSHELQLSDRGTIFKMSMDGSFEKIATGLRQPNGLVFSPDGELFVAENQGQWVPACKIIHIQEGHFYGCEFGAGDRFTGLDATPPAVWLPQDEIGNSPSQPLFISEGPYRGQMIHGEVTHGGVKRVFLEQVNGVYQGAVFRFTQGLEAGINRMAWGPDGALYVGGVGMNGNWAHMGHQFGLQKLVFKDELPFEILAIRNRGDGFEIEFTEAVAPEIANPAKLIQLQQWYYEATDAYGGPKLDLHDLNISSAEFSDDRTRLTLRIPGLKTGYVVYFGLDPQWTSGSGKKLWSGDAWYTLNEKMR
ncbi:c-type cytochrome [Flavilitoribacter nigricans]|uniref:c-type cytochrome n=1 Tax=Flavilitoribacter nigricans TaxID=70997 RepID=UPI00117B05BB|nr:c-type cytochrome [Flavilitoribacter nigricans]